MSVLQIGEVTLHYTEYGLGDEVVVFVHGNWTSSRCWLPTITHMPRRYRSIIFDQRGFGHSSKPQTNYTISERTEDLYALVNGLSLSRFHLVGHSLGGAVATQFALDHSQHLQSLFLLDAAPPSGMPIASEVRAYQDQFAANRDILAPALALAFGLAPNDPLFLALLEDGDAMAKHIVQANLTMLEQWQVADRLPTLQVPTTIAWGANDLVVSREAAEELHRLIPGSRLHIFETLGHSPNIEAPAQFVTVLLEALQQIIK